MAASQQPPRSSEVSQPAAKGLAAAIKQMLSHGSRQQHSAAANHSNRQSVELLRWLCGCTAARSSSSFASEKADAYLEEPVIIRKRSACSLHPYGGAPVLPQGLSRTGQAGLTFISPPSTIVILDSDLPGADAWMSLDSPSLSQSTAGQLACADKFSSYHSSVIFEEQAADAAWREFMAWRLVWMETASHQRFSYREADLQRHEADLLRRLQHSSAIMFCDSEGIPGSASSTSAALRSMPPAVGAKQSIKDWEMFLEVPDFMQCSSKQAGEVCNDDFSRARRRRMACSSISCAA